RLGLLPAARALDGDRARLPPRRRRDRLHRLPREGRRLPRARRPRLRDPAHAVALRHAGRPPAGDIVGAPGRLGLLLPRGLRRPREHPQRAARDGRRLARDALPRHPGRRRHEAGADRLPLPRTGGDDVRAPRLQRRHEHRHRRLQRRRRLARAARDGADALVEAHPRRAGEGSRVTAYASVYPLVTARALARAFTYEVEEGVGRGAIVAVPLGRGRARGVVVELASSAPDGVDVRPVDRVVGVVPPALVDLALWLADYYGSTPGRALALVAPELPKRRKEQGPPAESHSLAGEAEPASLTPEQRAAVARIAAGGGPYLLHGATGSGKTEVYLQACAAALARGRGAILLVPEIALTPQAVGRVRARFGDGVAILHSGLTDAQRRDERERIAAGEACVVVGARSAVFAPVRDLGLIVVDEEHDPSYKKDSDPRYDARTVAAKRAVLEG